MIRNSLFYILIVSFTTATNGGIIGSFNDTDTLDFYQGISFSSHAVNGLSGDAPCTSDIDFFIADYEKCCLSLNCHCGIRFGSKNQLYLSRKKIDLFDFHKELDLTDTASFIPAAKSEDFQLCSEAVSFWIESESGELDLTSYEHSFFVVKTGDLQYVLIRVTHLATYCYDVGQPCVDGENWLVDSKIKIDWTTGENNKPFFPDLVPLKTIVNRRIEYNTSRTITRYDLQGKKINEKNNTLRSGIIITKKHDGSYLKMLQKSGRK